MTMGMMGLDEGSDDGDDEMSMMKMAMTRTMTMTMMRLADSSDDGDDGAGRGI